MSKILVRDPFAEFDSLFGRQLPSAFGRRRRHSARAVGGDRPPTTWQLPVNVYEDDEGVGIEAWLPGYAEDEISVTVDDGQLRIRAEHSSDESSEGDSGQERTYRRREVKRSVLSRSFRLDPSYDASKISARLANGVLELSLPNGEESEPQQIAINRNSEAVDESI